MRILFALLACSSAPEPAVPAPAPAPAAAPAEPASQPEPAPAGRIGGAPILPDPVVLGAIDAAAVDAGIAAQRAAILRCWEISRQAKPGQAGKVLVKFTIARDGSVSNATTRSTSLRHPPTEQCLNARIMKARFPPLQDGDKALVSYPFVFPPAG